ncbi:MAG TPA: hypothetical protein VFI96_06920 [Longimicrobiaceae bacterium]|nr:hypothetical protein [Longimicrobiaceae bacterium]
MATTCKTLIEAAWARRTANDPDTLGTEAELIGVIDRVIKALYALAADVNPYYFGKTASVEGNGSVWPIPSEAVRIFKAVADGASGTGVDRKITTLGQRVSIMRFIDQTGEIAPAIYRFGSGYYSPGRAASGNALADPSPSVNGDKIKLFYSKRHPDLDATAQPDAAANTLDSTWPEHYNDLLVIPQARYLAIKDGREATEVQALDAEYEALERQFVSDLAGQDFGSKSRWAQMPRAPLPAPRG